jgi:hypothetical protein
MMRPTTSPSARTSKSSAFHSPDGREADARLRISDCCTTPLVLDNARHHRHISERVLRQSCSPQRLCRAPSARRSFGRNCIVASPTSPPGMSTAPRQNPIHLRRTAFSDVVTPPHLSLSQTRREHDTQFPAHRIRLGGRRRRHQGPRGGARPRRRGRRGQGRCRSHCRGAHAR